MEVSGFDLNECARIYFRNVRVNLTSSKQLCARTVDGGGTCTGDSGDFGIAEIGICSDSNLSL